jgi:hypothetical protein
VDDEPSPGKVFLKKGVPPDMVDMTMGIENVEKLQSLFFDFVLHFPGRNRRIDEQCPVVGTEKITIGKKIAQNKSFHR